MLTGFHLRYTVLQDRLHKKFFLEEYILFAKKMKIIIGNNNFSDSENLLNIYCKNKLIQLIIKVPIDPKKIILNV